jgi:hypothetical protein
MTKMVGFWQRVPRTLRSRRSQITPCSTLDFSLLHADRSALHIVSPVLLADFTRRSTLSPLRRLQIAPLPPPGACAGSRVTPRHGLLRVQHLELCTAYRLLCTRYSAFHVALGLLLARRFPLRAARGLLRVRRLTLHAGLRIAPYADTLRPRIESRIAPCSTLSPAPPQITLCPMLDAPFRLRIAPLSSLCAPVSTADCSVLNTLSFALNPDRSVFDTYRSAPNVNYSMFDTWLFIPLADCSAFFT